VRTYQTASPKIKKMEKKMDILEKIDTKLSDKLNESSISELKKNQPMPIPGLESMYSEIFKAIRQLPGV